MGDTDGTAPILAGTLDLLILKTLSAGAFQATASRSTSSGSHAKP